MAYSCFIADSLFHFYKYGLITSLIFLFFIRNKFDVLKTSHPQLSGTNLTETPELAFWQAFLCLWIDIHISQNQNISIIKFWIYTYALKNRKSAWIFSIKPLNHSVEPFEKARWKLDYSFDYLEVMEKNKCRCHLRRKEAYQAGPDFSLETHRK